MDRRLKVLMTGAGAPGGPGIIKALLQDPNIDLLVCDADSMASGRFLQAPFIRIPKANDAQFIEVLLSICESNGIDVLFPLVTMELFRLAPVKDMFLAKGIRVIVSDNTYLSISNNKSRLYEYLQNKGIPVPAFRVVTSISELEVSCIDLGYPKRPVVMKPSVSNGSRGVRILSEDKDEFDLLFNEKPGNLYSNLTRIKEILSGRDFPELLVSEYLPGAEYTIDTIVSAGKVRIVIPRKRLKMSGGISVAGVFVENRKVIDYCVHIVESMKLDGPIGLQVKEDDHSDFRILEINPRIQGTSVAAMGAGVNLPLLAVYNAVDKADFNIQVKWGVGFVRHYVELFYDSIS